MSDLISRRAVLDIVDDLRDQITVEGYCAMVERVKALPSAQPERTGRWIHDGYAFKGGIDWMHCSECGHKDSWSAATRTPFCAWCGARMMEDNNETD